jgi:hypothetical protein
MAGGIKREMPPIQTLKYKGIFDYPGLLKLVWTWGNRQGFEMHEVKSKHKVPDARGAEQEHTLLGWRKVNAYLKLWFKFSTRAEYLKDVDVVVDGQKKRLTQGKIRMRFSGHLEMDYNNRFGTSPFMEALRAFYHKFIIRQTIQNIWEDMLYYRLYKLNHKIKQHLDMEGDHYASMGRW